MRNLTPVEVLDVLAQRMEARAAALERVGLPGFEPTIFELRRFAEMVRKARAGIWVVVDVSFTLA